MKSRLLALPLAALFLAACSQDLATPTPDTTLGASGAAPDTYIMDFESAPELKVLWDVKVGRGVKYEGEGKALTDKIRVDGYNIVKGKKVGGNSAVVFNPGSSFTKILGLLPRNEKQQGGQLEIKPSQAFGGPSLGKNGLVTLKSITIYNVQTNGANIVLYGNGGFLKKIPLKNTFVQTLELDEPGVGFIQVNVKNFFAVDDVVFEVPNKETEFVGKEIVGNWEGTAYQGSSSYSVDLSVMKDPNANHVSATVTYPSLSCGGDWTFKSAESSRYNFTELITYGTNRCIASGDVGVTYNQDGSLSYDYGGGVATGTLYRVKD